MPTVAAPISLTTNIADVHGVTGKRAAAFRKLGIRGVADLLTYLPLRHEHQREEQTIKDAGATLGPVHGAEANIAVRGEIAALRAPMNRRAPTIATLQDHTGTMKLTWFNAPWVRKNLHPGMRIAVSGKAKRWGDYIDLVNPQWKEIKPDADAEPVPIRDERFVPVYPATELLPSSIIAGTIDSILDVAIKLVVDHFQDDYRRKNELPALADAYRMIHRPNDEQEIAIGRRRLAFDELLMLQLGVMMKRFHRRRALHAPILKFTPKIAEHIAARIPFTLTEGQQAVVKDITADLQKPAPMNRLLQGDVGSGKTVVALYAMLMAVASKHQAALMAPTELLAEQHFSTITQLLKGSRVNIDLLTGSLKAAQRKAIHKRLEAGEIDILIGTHALLSQTVTFKNLAIAVIDEQHRFGVHQRAGLRSKAGDAKTIPHTLVMTATPIPRTLSLTIFGDLDISTIKGMPPGRKPIITKVVPQAKAADVYQYVAKQVETGAQAYVVVPVIDESESGLKDVTTHLQFLKQGVLSRIRGRLQAMHGRLDREERELIMRDFRTGKIDVLVSTTVIEVGVDVPNASIMVIEHAERFGLAQLHQLRGRVGRGARKSLCVLIAEPTTDDGKARIEAIVSTTDGFQIAEKDFEIRGPGELFGARQSGLAPFRAAELPRDTALLRLARRDASKWIQANPTLAGERDALLRKRLLKLHGEALGLADVA